MTNVPSSSRALISSSRTPRQNAVMTGTQGRNQVDCQAIITNGTKSGRRVYNPETQRNATVANRYHNPVPAPAQDVRSLSLSASPTGTSSSYGSPSGRQLTEMGVAAGQSSLIKKVVDPAGAGGLPRGKKVVSQDNNRAAQAANGSGDLPDRVDKRMLKKIEGKSSFKTLSAVDDSPDYYLGGKKCLSKETVQAQAKVNNVFKNEDAPVRRSTELAEAKEDFKKLTSPKDHGYTFKPNEKRFENREINAEARLMNNGSVPRKTRKTNFARKEGFPRQTAKEAATPPWVHPE